MVNITELKQRARIADVWAGLGGPELRGNRGRGWWRGGDGFSVALDFEKGLWHDHRDGVGGDVVTLVRTVRQCGFREALEWLADFTGTSAPEQVRHQHVDTDWVTDLRWATWWGMTAEMLAEWLLEQLAPWHPDRCDLTLFLNTIRLGDAALVNEYRDWRRREPVMTRGMALAGQRSDARVQRKLMAWIGRYVDESPTARDYRRG